MNASRARGGTTSPRHSSVGTDALLTQPLRQRAASVARDVLARIADHFQPSPGASGHETLPRSDVAAGLALAFAEFDLADPHAGWDVHAHRMLELAVAGGDRGVIGPYGPPGAAAAAWAASRGGARYTAALANLRPAEAERATVLTARLAHALDHDLGTTEFFDSVTGLAGALADWSLSGQRDDVPGWVADGAQCLSRVLVRDERRRPLGRITVPELDPTAQCFPFGYIDLGACHGIAGPLAILALLLLDHTVDGSVAAEIRSAVEQGCSFLMDTVRDSPEGLWWPRAVRLTEDGAAGTRRAASSGWCVGVTGTARALDLAGRALGERGARAAAARVLVGASKRVSTTPSTGICHGIAGVTLTLYLLARESGDPVVVEACRDAVEQLLDRHESSSRFGFRDRDQSGVPIDDPGLRSGSAGVALVLHALSTGAPPRWSRLFLLM